MGAPAAAFPRGEEDVYAWAQSYVAEQQTRMRAASASGVRPVKPSRAEVTRAVQARFGTGSGRQGGVLTWLRVMYWVMWILLSL